MIRLFRIIRKKLLESNKIKSYMLYAAGEIILVVIGIFIAIQLNDLNEQRKERNKEQTYYCKLLQDIRQDKLEIDRLIRETDNRIYHSNKFLSLLQKDTLDAKMIAEEMFNAIAYVTFTFSPSIASFDDIKSSGNLGVLGDSIKKELIEYYVYVEGIVDVVDINSDQAVRLVHKNTSYVEEGWQFIGIVTEAIDTTVVDFDALRLAADPYKNRNALMSDALFYIAVGARVKMLYRQLETRIQQVEELLISKCTQ